MASKKQLAKLKEKMLHSKDFSTPKIAYMSNMLEFRYKNIQYTLVKAPSKPWSILTSGNLRKHIDPVRIGYINTKGDVPTLAEIRSVIK